ncbi:MAG: TylF/MycF/NovP-related O-methyltransferase [Myxococcota bacterium]
MADRILSLSGRSGLTILEAGAGKGASTAKLSLATARAGGRLLVLDSFRGIPANDEVHRHLDGRTIRFRAGAFVGRLESVKRTVAEFGAIEVCTFKKGLFSETLPTIEGPIDVALLDVDLLSSTRDCVRALYPRLRPGGALFSQDGHLRGIVEMLADPKFWRGEVGVEPPSIPGLGRDKLLEIVKPYSRWARR